MKTKNLSKKLVLSKETVSNLSLGTMKEVLGGTNDSEQLPCFTYLITMEVTFCPNFTCRFRFCDATLYPDQLCI